MSERGKKLLFAAFFVLVSAGMGYAIYYILFHSPQAAQPSPTTQAPTSLSGNLPQAGPGTGTNTTSPGTSTGLPTSGNIPTTAQPAQPSGTEILRDAVTQATSPTPDGNGARFYNPEDGRFYTITPDGKIVALSDRQFFNVNTVDWGNSKNEAILTFPDGSNLYYDFQQQQQVNLPGHWQDFNFSPTDDKVVAKSIGIDPDNRVLIVTNPNGTEAQAVETLGDNADQMHVAWSPEGQILGYATTGDAQSNNQQQILFIGQNHENFKSIIAPGQDFLPNWSPTGKQILYSVWSPDNGNKPSLWLSSGEPTTMGANRKSLQINTWADKCVWAGETDIFCGVPQDLPENAGLQRSEFATLPDDVYHIDLTLGSAVKINTPDQTFPVRAPIVTKDKTKFIFTDASTGKLYSYDIK